MVLFEVTVQSVQIAEVFGLLSKCAKLFLTVKNSGTMLYYRFLNMCKPFQLELKICKFNETCFATFLMSEKIDNLPHKSRSKDTLLLPQNYHPNFC